MGTIGSASAKPYDFGGIVDDVYSQYVGTLLNNNGANAANNNTFVDSSSAPFTITRAGNVGQGRRSPFAPQGYSWFIGQNNYYPQTLAGGPVISPTVTFTIEAWVFIHNPITTGEYFSVIANNTNGFNSPIYYMFGVNSKRQATFVWTDVNGVQEYSHPTQVPLNTWTYIQVTSTSGALGIGVNGVKTNTPFYTRTTLTTPTSLIAQFVYGVVRQYTPGGYIAGLRVSNVVRPYTLPNGYFSSDSDTRLLCAQTNRFNDVGPNNIPFTVNNYPSTYPFTPFNAAPAWTQAANGGSAQFAGDASTYLSVPDNANLELGSGNWCIEAWLMPQTASGNAPAICKRANSASVGSFILQRQGTTLNFYLSSNGTTYDIVNGTSLGSLLQLSWYHVAIYRIGNAVYGSLNGTITTLYNSTAFTVTNVTSPTYIGGDSDGNPWVGMIGPIRQMVGGVPTGYSSTSCPVPTAPFTNDANTKLLLLFSNGNVVDTNNKTSLGTNSGMNLSTAQTKFSTAALNFTGATYGTIGYGPNFSSLALGGGDFTLELWLWATNFVSGRFFLDVYNNNSASRYGIKTDITTGIWTFFGSGSSAISTSTVALTGSTWTHLAITRVGTTLRLFQNGAQVAQRNNYTQFTSFDSTNAYFGTDGGSVGTSPALGYISNFRVTRGIARYTGNFTLPLSAYPTFIPKA